MPFPKLEIRAFEPNDLAALQSIREAAFKPVFHSLRSLLGMPISAIALAGAEAEQAHHLAMLCDPASAHQVYVASIGGDIVGFVSYRLDQEKRIGEIGLNAVHPRHSGHGIGTHLYQFSLDAMKRAGMLLATVGTGGDASHAAARRAYEKAGFGHAIQSVWMYRLL